MSGEIEAICSKEFLFRRVDRSQPKGVGHSLDIYELPGGASGSARVAGFMLEPPADGWDEVIHFSRK